ncbi:MAG: molybdopterin molybdotransferase MoeA [Armatimonadetes bacterium]|nr:molybdopterin molybdotransferase MoeA [Armatimonadota bacterium]
MITYDEALRTVLDSCPVLGAEDVEVSACLGRYLSEDVLSPLSLPAFDNSAVDGYALRASDIAASPVTLPVVGTVFAGDDPGATICEPGSCVRIMTGAGVPRGADSVVMQEDVEASDGSAVFHGPVGEAGQHVRPAGEEIKSGDLAFCAGARCNPAVIGALATLGLPSVRAHRVPRVGVMVTGTELAAPGEPLNPGQVYESNGVALKSALVSLGVRHVAVEMVGDDPDETAEVFRRLAEECDVVLTSGGASVGERDLVRGAFLANGVEEKFWRVSMKPGKPVFFGTTDSCLVFGLPGNPVSALVTFEVLAAPAVRKMSGSRSPEAVRESVVLAEHIRRKPGRLEFVRATTEHHDGRAFATPVGAQGSHMMSGLAHADRLLIVAADADCIEAGTVLDSVPLRWGGSA